MITSRDKQILRWMEKYNAITINQAKTLFFNGRYDNARRRLRLLEQQDVISSYTLRETKEKVYFWEKKLSFHDLYVLDYLTKLVELGCELVDVIIKPHYLNNTLIPDAFVKFSYKGDLYLTFLEVDYKHATEDLKFKSSYERLYREKDDHIEFQGTFPIVVIANHNASIRYNSSNFSTVWTTLDYQNLKDLLL